MRITQDLILWVCCLPLPTFKKLFEGFLLFEGFDGEHTLYWMANIHGNERHRRNTRCFRSASFGSDLNQKHYHCLDCTLAGLICLLDTCALVVLRNPR